MKGTTDVAAENTPVETRNSFDNNGNSQPVAAVAKTSTEIALEGAHSELVATARMCAKMTEPKRVKVPNADKKARAEYFYEERHITRHNLDAMGGAAIEALSKYYVALKEFEASAA